MAQAPLDPTQDTKVISVRLVEELVNSYEELATLKNTDRSSLFREALDAYLEQHHEVLAS